MENDSIDNNKKAAEISMQAPKEEKRKSRKGIIIFLIILVVLQMGGLGYLGWLYYELSNKQVVLETKLDDTVFEKEQITSELEELLVEYEAMETDNESVKAELEHEKQKITDLLKEIKRIKSANSWEIKKYKDEAETLRKIMKGFVHQIDSLNTLAQTYKNKFTAAKSDYNESVKAYDSLSVERDQLSSKVDLATTLKAVNISALAINNKSKPVTKTKKINKLKICFTIRENVIAQVGSKWIYVRVARPDGLVIINDPNNIFYFEGNSIAFTERRQLEYKKQDVDMCIYWKKNQDLIPGLYGVDIFSDGKKIGTTNFTLK